MKVDGICHCGHITYEAEIDPDDVFLCHCTDCQTLTGSAFRLVVRVDEADYKQLTGEVKTYIKTAESGNLRAQTFCPECGTAIYATDAGDTDGPRFFGLRIATARQRDFLPPKRHFWHRSAQPWITDLDGLEVVGQQ